MAHIHFVTPWKAAAPMLSLERSPSVHWLLLPQLIIPATRCEWLSSTCSKRVVDAVAKYFIKRLLQTELRKCNCNLLLGEICEVTLTFGSFPSSFKIAPKGAPTALSERRLLRITGEKVLSSFFDLL
jgi:hypothetical protein